MKIAQLRAQDTTEHLAPATNHLDELEVGLASLANSGPMQVGRIPERLGHATVLTGDARDLVAQARREWIEL